MKRLLLLLILVSILASCGKPLTSAGGEVTGVRSVAFNEPAPYGMVLIQRGSYQMGISENDSLWGISAEQKGVSVDAFWMDETEVSNAKYRQFVYWVRDSIIRERLADPAYGGNDLFKITEDRYGDPVPPHLDWSRPIPWRRATEEEQRAIESVYTTNPVTGEKRLDPKQMNFKYEWYDYTAAALRKMGIEPFIPPYTSKRTLSLGTKNSPEAICLPYKLILGNFIEAIEGGVDYVAMITSPGICRLGEYGKNIKNVLKDLGYDANYIELNLYNGFQGMWDFLSRLTGNGNPITIIRAINIAIRKVFAIDEIENFYSYHRAREINFGDSEKAYKKALKLIDNALTTKELKKALKEGLKEIAQVKIDPDRDVLHVDLTGEIFLVLDQFANQNIEKELGRMGVQTRRSLTVSGFLKDAIIPKMCKKGETHLERAFRMAKPYLMRDIGGDALECISDVMYAKEKGTDGLIHVSPFTCMPEIMSQNIFPKMREDIDIPILSLIMDEQTGKAGYLTRLEAFVDLMRRKKMKNKIALKTKENIKPDEAIVK